MGNTLLPIIRSITFSFFIFVVERHALHEENAQVSRLGAPKAKPRLGASATGTAAGAGAAAAPLHALPPAPCAASGAVTVAVLRVRAGVRGGRLRAGG